MAQFNLIQRPDLNDRLVRALGIRERAPAATLSPEVVPIVLLEDLSKHSPYERSLQRVAGAFGVHASSGGQQPCIQLKNPAASGTVLMLERVCVSGLTIAGRFIIGQGAPSMTDLVGTLSKFWKDSRFDGNPVGDARNGQKAVSPVLTIFGCVLALNQFLVIDNLELVIPPGKSVFAQLQVANAQFEASMEWSEYTS